MASLRDLDIRHLVAFDAVATEGTFARAAGHLGYTQSAVSQQIAALERIIGDPVFDRPGGPRPVELTPLGAQLLAHSRALLARLDQVEEDLDLFRTGGLGRLNVGTFQSISATVLPLLMGRMRVDLPELDVVGFESDIDEVLVERLAMGEVDVSFLIGDISDEFESRHLLDDPFLLLAQPGQYPPGSVAAADIAHEPMVGQHDNSVRHLKEAGLRRIGITPNVVFRTNDNNTVAAMVRAGVGVAILPLLCTEPEDPRVSLHTIDPPIAERQVSIAWRAGRTLSPAAMHFIEVAVQVAKELTGLQQA